MNWKSGKQESESTSFLQARVRPFNCMRLDRHFRVTSRSVDIQFVYVRATACTFNYITSFGDVPEMNPGLSPYQSWDSAGRDMDENTNWLHRFCEQSRLQDWLTQVYACARVPVHFAQLGWQMPHAWQSRTQCVYGFSPVWVQHMTLSKHNMWETNCHNIGSKWRMLQCVVLFPNPCQATYACALQTQ